jgi:hypothetical protein
MFGKTSLDTPHHRLKASSYIFSFISLFFLSLYYTELGAAYDMSAMTVELNIFPQYGLVHRCQRIDENFHYPCTSHSQSSDNAALPELYSILFA